MIDRNFTRFAIRLTFAIAVCVATGSSFAQHDPNAKYHAWANYYRARAEQATAGAANTSAYGAIIASQANMLRARGEFTKSQAEAFGIYQQGLKAQQEVHSLRMDNDLKHADMFYKKRAMHETYRAARAVQKEAPKQPSPKADRGKPEAQTVSTRTTTLRIAPHILDRGGNISWAHVLMDPKFKESRRKLDAIFAARSRGESTWRYREVKTLAAEMKTTLKLMIRDIPADEYLAATKLLDALTHESRLAPATRRDRIVAQPVRHRNST